ncbi:nucleotidyltransferase domain-containing protein [Tahibacter amnicola]|uniref:Nucleotidyltransferase domain-containing protein n=1 Tax=Tahibacter amnicola TaxID=2976241 RepID=A0ABY6BGA6_9GAMM|nr:nucleotidyltransferase domain-containing protein [Tahibacter amnicola]UXI69063.1 nucleotidyltransferase domain-containing protein [Tahibacter amnicola]
MLDIDSLLRPGHPAVLFTCISGSHAYGTATAASDEDIRGLFVFPMRRYLDLTAPPDQIADARNDRVFYSLRRAMVLLAQGNPNLLELLFMPDDCVRFSSPGMAQLVAHRHLFLTRECAQAHLNYAFSQVKKARGQNKWINNPKPVEAPRKEDFCHLILQDRGNRNASPPARPVRVDASGIDLSRCRVARLEHARDVYRLYRGGSAGVFRGDNLVCESIPVEAETTDYIGLLLYNEGAWRQAMADHHNYWTWRRERNESRWQMQERGEVDYDAKNLKHTLRLLMSGESILTRATPIVRFEGDDLALLRDVRGGRYTYTEILAMAQTIMARCEPLLAASDLPAATDPAQASELLAAITAQWECRQ